MDFSKFCQQKITEEHAEAMGKDCRLNGANTKNCAFYLFSRPELTRAWERGKRTDAAPQPLPQSTKEK